MFVCTREGKLQREWIFVGRSGERRGREKNKSHLSSIFAYVRRLFASKMKVCDSGLVHLYALMRDIPVCISYTCIYMCNACVRACLTRSGEKKKPQEALKGFTVYHCIWPNE